MSNTQVNEFKIGDMVIGNFTRKKYTVTGVDVGHIQLNDHPEWVPITIFTLDKQPETYTTEQLSEIDELRDRIDMLDSLCRDYVEQIEGLDYVVEEHKKALNKFTKLTVLLSENHKVADLVGAQIGDDVVDKIYDYLLSQVKQKTDFKPISEMTIEDWQQALDEEWLFEDNEEDTCQVVDVDKEMQLIEFDEYIGKFDIQGDYTGGHPYYITKRIK